MLDLPPTTCERCGGCCGIVPCTEAEFQAVQRYAQTQQVTPRRQGITCPYWQQTGCLVYPVRPLLCQLMGHTPRLTCRHGHNHHLPDKQVERLMRKYRKKPATRYLHEACFLPATILELLHAEAEHGN